MNAGKLRLLTRSALLWPLQIVGMLFDTLLSPRLLQFATLAAAGLLTLASWLRPPLSPDIRGIHLALGVWGAGEQSPEQLLNRPSQIPIDSLGAMIILVIAFGMILLIWRPRWFGLIAGTVLSVALAANAAAVLNHPTLIETLDLQLEQRAWIVPVLRNLDETFLTTMANGRVNEPIPELLERGGLLTGWPYLQYGQWLVGLGILAVLLGMRRSIARAIFSLIGWTIFGAGLALIVCLPRIKGEFYWRSAARLEAQNDFAGAYEALEKAVQELPELDRIQRTWLLGGKCDYRSGLTTTRSQFWQASQLASNGEFAHANAIMTDLVKESGDSPVVRRQAARLLTMTGLRSLRDSQLIAARESFRKAAYLDRQRMDCAVFLGVIQSQVDSAHPELVESELKPVMNQTADRVLRADLLCILGDAYFHAGHMVEARSWYRQSLACFNLPKTINYVAQKGLVGL